MRWILPLLVLGLFIMTAARATDVLCGVNGCVERHHDASRERDYYGDRDDRVTSTMTTATSGIIRAIAPMSAV